MKGTSKADLKHFLRTWRVMLSLWFTSAQLQWASISLRGALMLIWCPSSYLWSSGFGSLIPWLWGLGATVFLHAQDSSNPTDSSWQATTAWVLQRTSWNTPQSFWRKRPTCLSWNFDLGAGLLCGMHLEASRGLPWWLNEEAAYSAGDSGSIPGLGRSPGEGNGNPIQYSCLESQSHEQRRLEGYSPGGHKKRLTHTQKHREATEGLRECQPGDPIFILSLCLGFPGS